MSDPDTSKLGSRGQESFPAEPELISIVVPVWNEAAVIQSFYDRIRTVIDALSWPFELIFVNDGSNDSTLPLLLAFQTGDQRIRIIDLSRNFGKEIAMTAGLDHAAGNAAIVIDADLQDPPELIPDLIRSWLEGNDVVYARRRSRRGEGRLKKATAYLFYRLINRLAQEPIPEDTGDFRLLDRRVLDALAGLRERHRYMKGLFAWVGFRQHAIDYDRDPRFAGTSKWRLLGLVGLATEGLTSFSLVPLRLASLLGSLTAICGFAYGLVIALKKVILGDPVQGFPSLVALIAIIGGVQLLALGIIGEYVGRIFNETKQRPLYLIRERYGEVGLNKPDPRANRQPASGHGPT